MQAPAVRHTMDQEGQHTPVQVVHVMKVPEVLNILDPEVMLMTAPVVPDTPGQEAPLTMALVERHMVAQAAPATLEQEGRATPGLVVQEKIVPAYVAEGKHTQRCL